MNGSQVGGISSKLSHSTRACVTVPSLHCLRIDLGTMALTSVGSMIGNGMGLGYRALGEEERHEKQGECGILGVTEGGRLPRQFAL